MRKNKTLKGIPSDIDLTEERDFRPGTVNPMYIESPETGSLPWDKDGKPKIKKPNVVTSNYTWTMNNSFLQLNEYIEDRNYSFSNIKFTDRKVISPETDKPKKAQSKKYTLEDDLNTIKTTMNKKIFLRAINRIMKRIPNVRRGVNTSIIIPGCKNGDSVKHMNYTRYYYAWFSNADSSIWDNNTSSAIHQIKSDMIDDTDDLTIIPLCIPEIKISHDELHDNVLLTGNGEDLYNKRIVYKFFKEFNKIRDKNYPIKHWKKEKCYKCYHPYWICDNHNMGCPYCARNQELANIYQYKKLHTIKEKSIDIHHSKLHHLYEDIMDAHYVLFRDGEYFDDLIYQDGGLHLIRLNQGEHELRVGFGHQSYDYDDDSDEIRNDRFEQYPLISSSTGRFHKMEMQRDSMDEIRNIINTLSRV